MVDGAEDRVRDRDPWFVRSTMPHHAAMPRGERTILRAARAQGGLDGRDATPAVAFAGRRRFVLAGALVAAGTEAGPTGQMPVAGGKAHVHAELGDDHLSRALMDAGDRVQLRQLLGERGEVVVDLLTHRGDRLVEILEMRQQLPDEKSVMRAEAAAP